MRRCAVLASSANYLLCLGCFVPCALHPAFLMTFFKALLKRRDMDSYDTDVRILCVDDEINVLKALQRVFMDDNYEVVIASSGEEGLSKLEQGGPFQVIVSDYRMPVMNGVDFLKQAFRRGPQPVGIVLSGYADASVIVDDINEGHIYRFIPKPWNDEELRITIQNCLERYFLQKKNRELLEKLELVNHELEEKVLQRTEQLEIRNRALEFSQNLMGNLPVGVLGVDENGLVVFINTMAVKLLKPICADILGMGIEECGDGWLGRIAGQVPPDGVFETRVMLNGDKYRVIGRRIIFFESVSTALVIIQE